jgi:MbtH protein
MFEHVKELTVVINPEEQYSIWPAHRKLPDGWQPVGKTGTFEECIRYIDEVWTDMRPKSLRRLHAENEPGGA